MKKSILFLTLVSMLLMASCGNKAQQTTEGQDSVKAECKQKCGEHEEFMAKWAQFETLEVAEQEALLAKRAECYAKRLERKAECQNQKPECANKEAGCKGKTADCKGKDTNCENKKAECQNQKAECEAKKAECEKAMAELDALWAKYPTMTIAEKKAFFDKFDSVKPKKGEGLGQGCGEKKGCGEARQGNCDGSGQGENRGENCKCGKCQTPCK